MRLHKISLLNLNSLYGEQCLDLDKDLAGASLFLIHGRTGSGKSTLMDAVSLALFGSTPRLDGKHNTPDADPCSVMSRGTGECRATVEFSRLGPKGERIQYRAQWAVRRAKKKADGKLQAVERSLEELQGGTWETLVSGKKKALVVSAFDGALEGFGAEDFQRSMLLAQGRFDEFLNASEVDRSTILERLTDTSEYKRLGDYAAQLAAAHRKNLDFLDRQRDGTEPLSPAESQAARVAAEASAQAYTYACAKLERIKTDLGWWAQFTHLRQQLEALTPLQLELQKESQEAEKMIQTLQEHDRCSLAFEAIDEAKRQQASVDTCLVEIEEKNKEQVQAQVQADISVRVSQDAQKRSKLANDFSAALRAPSITLEARLVDERTAKVAQAESAKRQEQSKNALGAQERHLTQSELNTAAAVKSSARAEETLSELSALVPLRTEWQDRWQEVCVKLRASEELLRGADAELNTTTDKLKSDRARYERHKSESAAAEKAHLSPAEAALVQCRAQLQTLCGSADVEAARTAQDEAFQRAQQLLNGTEVAKRELADQQALQLELTAAQTKEAVAKKNVASAIKDCAHTVECAQHAAERAEDAEFHHERLRLVGEIAARRQALTHGEDCPLCGSGVHPYVDDPTSCPDEASAQQVLKEAQSEKDTRQQRAAEAERKARAAETFAATLRASYEGAKEVLADACGRHSVKTERVSEALEVANLTKTCSIDECANLLAERQKALIQLQSAKEALRTAIDAFMSSQKELERIKAQLAEALVRSNQHGSTLAEQERRLQVDQTKLVSRQAELVRETEILGQALKAFGGMFATELPASADLALSLGTWQQQVEGAIVRLANAERACVAAKEKQRRADEGSSRAKLALDATLVLHKEIALGAEVYEVSLREIGAQLNKCRREISRLWSEYKAARLPLPESIPVPPNELQELSRRLERSLSSEHEAANALATRAQAAVTQLQGQLTSLSRQHKTLVEQSRVAEHSLKLILQELDESNAESLEARRLSIETYRKGNEVAASLALRQQEQDTQIKERQSAIEIHQASLPADSSLPIDAAGNSRQRQGENNQPDDTPDQGITAQLNQTLEQARLAQVRATEVKEQKQAALAEIERRAAASAKADATLRQAQSEAEIWQRLSALIGTSKGDAFRNFAQGLNLHRLIIKANHHLKRLSERYQLTQAKRDGIPTLDFAIVDLWQVGEPRSPRSLSGGERFLVSLALALGLSDLRSQSLPIETLLLDEGFGTLDPETLGIALSALQRLQADGRQVGVISHVGGLKERIAAQVHIIEEGGGRSRIQVDSPV